MELSRIFGQYGYIYGICHRPGDTNWCLSSGNASRLVWTVEVCSDVISRLQWSLGQPPMVYRTLHIVAFNFWHLYSPLTKIQLNCATIGHERCDKSIRKWIDLSWMLNMRIQSSLCTTSTNTHNSTNLLLLGYISWLYEISRAPITVNHPLPFPT